MKHTGFPTELRLEVMIDHSLGILSMKPFVDWLNITVIRLFTRNCQVVLMELPSGASQDFIIHNFMSEFEHLI